MSEPLRPDEITWSYGPEPMLIEDGGMVDHLGANGKPVRYRIGFLKPLDTMKSPQQKTERSGA